MNWEYSQPVRIIFGNGSISRLREEIGKIGGNNGLLITSQSFEKKGLTDKLKESTQGKIKLVYSKVSPNPTVEECDECAQIMRLNNCDFVVAMGGGSVMDCAKAAATFLSNVL